MKTYTIKSLCLLIFSTIITACSNVESGYFPESKVNNTESSDYYKAIELVKIFSVETENTKKTSNSTPNIKFIDYEKTTLKDLEVLKSANNQDNIDSVNIYTFSIEVEGEKGFAIAPGDENVGRVYAFVKNGSLVDTARIKGMAKMIRNIPLICKQDIQTYNTETTELNFKSTTNYSTRTYPKLIYTVWAQGDPYNELMPYDCRIPGNRRTRYPVGCVGVAIAQSAAYYKRNDILYHYDDRMVEPSIPSFADDNIRFLVSALMKTVADGINTIPDCGGSISNFEKSIRFLASWNMTGTYAKSNDVDHNKLLDCIKRRDLILASGQD